jgi:acyl transferase domain-containing protein
MAGNLSNGHSGPPADAGSAQHGPDQVQTEIRKPVAIVGMAYEFSGGINNDEAFWDMLMAGRSTAGLVPKDRFTVSSFYHKDTNRLDTVSSLLPMPVPLLTSQLPNMRGHFLQDDIATFDAPFFGIKKEEAAAMDPQSRALLELSYQALENGECRPVLPNVSSVLSLRTAGIPLDQCSGTNTSVYIGCSSDDYRLLYAKDPERPIRHAATGMARSMLANKISWYYNLLGPSLVIDTACSSSLNALHLACVSLQTGESHMV